MSKPDSLNFDLLLDPSFWRWLPVYNDSSSNSGELRGRGWTWLCFSLDYVTSENSPPKSTACCECGGEYPERLLCLECYGAGTVLSEKVTSDE